MLLFILGMLLGGAVSSFILALIAVSADPQR